MTHPQNCETCSFRNVKLCPYWKRVSKGMFEDKKETIWLEASVATVGCASHSDAVKEREKELGKLTDFHFNITNRDHHEIEKMLKSLGIERSIASSKVPDYKVSRCCAVHCEEVYAYWGINPGYCTKCIRLRKNAPPQGVPYGQSKL